MRDEVPVWPCCPGDFFASEKCASLDDTEAEDCYLKLLAKCWQLRGLPTDTKELWKVIGGARLRGQAIVRYRERLRKVIDRCFEARADGRLWNKRIKRDLSSAMAERKMLSKMGKLGAKKRWGGHPDGQWHPSPRPRPSSPLTPLTPAKRGGSSLRSQEKNPRSRGTNPRAAAAADPEREALIHRLRRLAKRKLNGYEVVSTGIVHSNGNEEPWGMISTERLRKILGPASR